MFAAGMMALVLVGSDARAEGDKAPPLEVGASMLTRYEFREGYDDVGQFHPRFHEGDATAYRARLILQTKRAVSDDLKVKLRFAPQSSGFYGADTGSGSLSDAELGMHEGFISILGGGHEFQAGRFEMIYGEHLIVGNVAWHQTARSFDGVRGKFKLGEVQLDVFGTQLSEGYTLYQATPFGSGDSYFTGVYAHLGGAVAEGMALDLYALRTSAPAVDDALSDTGATVTSDAWGYNTIGTRIKHDTGAVDFRLEAGTQIGSFGGASVFAYQADGEVGIDISKAHLALGGLYATGDDADTADIEGWFDPYSTAHKFLGFTDVMGVRTNVAGGNVKLDVPLADKTRGYLHGHTFFRPVNAGEGMAGSEADLGVIHTLGKGLKLRADYALFIPSDGYYGTTTPVHFASGTLFYSM